MCLSKTFCHSCLPARSGCSPPGNNIDRQAQQNKLPCPGLADLGRPPFLTTARLSLSSVSSGSSLYSTGFTTCASTRTRSELKVRARRVCSRSFALSTAKNVAHRATRGVANYHHVSGKQAERKGNRRLAPEGAQLRDAPKRPC